MPVALAQALVLDVVAPLSADQVSQVDPAARFLVEVAARLEDARLVLVDERDSLIPMEGTVEIGTRSRFTLTPNEPLIPGSVYTLRLEGSVRREVHDTEGNIYLPSVLRLKTSGEKPQAAPPGKKRIGKKRR